MSFELDTFYKRVSQPRREDIYFDEDRTLATMFCSERLTAAAHAERLAALKDEHPTLKTISFAVSEPTLIRDADYLFHEGQWVLAWREPMPWKKAHDLP
jgi:hypothetical protein